MAWKKWIACTPLSHNALLESHCFDATFASLPFHSVMQYGLETIQIVKERFESVQKFPQCLFKCLWFWVESRVRPIYRSRRLIGRFIGIGRLSDRQITKIPISDRYRIGQLLGPISVDQYGYIKSPNLGKISTSLVENIKKNQKHLNPLKTFKPWFKPLKNFEALIWTPLKFVIQH